MMCETNIFTIMKQTEVCQDKKLKLTAQASLRPLASFFFLKAVKQKIYYGYSVLNTPTLHLIQLKI